MKISAQDAAHILYLYQEADEAPKTRLIEQLKSTMPTPYTLMVSFRYQKQLYTIFMDVTAEDDTSYLFSFIAAEKPDSDGEFIQNPTSDIVSYALPFKGKEVYLFKQKPQKRRLDTFLSETYPETSRSTWQKYIKAGYVTVDGTIVSVPKYEINPAAKVSVSIPEAADHSDSTLPIIYLDENVIVINKPVGILTHSKGALTDEFTVADFFRRYTTYNLDTNRPGIVHRLDRDTSGVLVGARNPETATLLQKQFADRTTKKTYLAVVAGIPKESTALIDLPIGRNPTEPSTFRVDAKGKAATTRYRIIAHTDSTSLVELQPLTGRTHQLRVHMAYLNTPIYGDRVYGKPAERLFLHARQLELTIPTGQRKVFTAPIPQAFQKLYPEAL